MTYEQVKSLKPEDFKRLCGVRPETNNCDARDSAMPAAGVAIALKKTKKVLQGEKEKAYTGGGASPAPLKSQVAVNQANGEIICTAHGKGREHDFRIFKNSKVRLKEKIECLGDIAFLSLVKYSSNNE
ncbi:hypothetical protein LC609_28450 [Nostoc sp. XA013]|nr:hypothetical protein [Nostoc sp. XA013]